MLTKEERAAIAERANECVAVCGSLYVVLLGHPSACNATYEEDMKKLLARIIDLCDTSNMVELSMDKDGAVIRIGDVVYDDFGMEREVSEFRFLFDGACIYARTDDSYDMFRPDELAHKATTTITENIEAFNEAVKVTAQYVEASMNECVDAMKKLAEVFNRVVDSDD